MKVNGHPYRSIERDGLRLLVIDQTRLPHRFERIALDSVDDVAAAIRNMVVRGAPLIGVTAAYGLALALARDPGDDALQHACGLLAATRPTAINLRWALQQVVEHVTALPPSGRAAAALERADALAEADVATNAAIGAHGAGLLRTRWEALGRPPRLNVLTHCNAGWLGCVDWGTALAALYRAHDQGVPLHVWIDETRPRNQGASLTTWELASHGIDATLITDNAGGYLMRARKVDACIVGADRVSALGDVCNKVGTYLKALAAADNGIPFYVAMPLSTLDWQTRDGQSEIPVEDRGSEEVTHISGLSDRGTLERVRLAPEGTRALNPAFDITPARLISALITEHGVFPASEAGLAPLRQAATR
ncbi:S-methyl-5-thioribose-1-phosphate isomerase [Paludibacterium yongneupense]|uniref:S-methyl-5-thioribose-1-phosphate isomerase n=1 Tax=Paludibacterium yongneupense TaxID=400061 RepID=UPI00041D1966|nr:S-methyl-5-thioribose-1-phosphate isomerase [Paludibacterium yongneupense]